MMGGMLLVVVCICYCCHKRVQKTDFPEEGEISASDQWLQDDSDSTLQVFTLDSPRCYEIDGGFMEVTTPRHSPPPSYDDVVAPWKNDPDLPSYETAVSLQPAEKPSPTFYMDELTYI